MNENILIVYKSITGFTKEYAEMIAEELDCDSMDFKDVTTEIISGFHIIVFGGRFHAGFVDGLKQAKKLFGESKAERLVVFATGATPNAAEELIQEAWKNNFTPSELEEIPHFYMQSGLRYENMQFFDKWMMKAFAAMMKRKKDKNVDEKGMEQAISGSYDISSREYIKPLVSFLQEEF